MPNVFSGFDGRGTAGDARTAPDEATTRTANVQSTDSSRRRSLRSPDRPVRRQEAPRRECDDDGGNDGGNQVGRQRPVPAQGYKAPSKQRIGQHHRDQAQGPPRRRGVHAACAGTKRKIREDTRPIMAAATNKISESFPCLVTRSPACSLQGVSVSRSRGLASLRNGEPLGSMCRASQRIRLFSMARTLPSPTVRARKREAPRGRNALSSGRVAHWN